MAIKFERGFRKHLFSIDEACFSLSISPTTLNKLIDQGDVEAVKVGERTMIPEPALIKFLTGLPLVTKRQRIARAA